MEIPKLVPVVVEPAVETQPTEAEILKEIGFHHPHERTPSNWAIEARDEGTIWARNRMTMRVFEGQMELFNVLLKA